MLIPEFQRFRTEGETVGRLLAGYGRLELDLCNCVAMGKGGEQPLDVPVKAMFRARGETQRLDIADAFGRAAFRSVGLGDMFSEAISNMRYCLKIRNQYAHCQWLDDYTGRLCFVDMEEIAKRHTVITDFSELTPYYLTSLLLGEQEKYFEYVGACLTYLNYDARMRAGTISTRPHAKPRRAARPPLHIQ